MPMKNKASDMIFDDNATIEELIQRTEQLGKYFEEKNAKELYQKSHPLNYILNCQKRLRINKSI